MAGSGFHAKSENDGFEWSHEVVGLFNTVTFAIGEDPDDADWILAGQGDNELLHSIDAGESWTNFSLCASLGSDSCWGGMVSSLAFDPIRAGQALALFAGGGNGYAGKGKGNRRLVRLWKAPFDYEIVHRFPDIADPALPEGNRNLLAYDPTGTDECFMATVHKADDGQGGSYETGVWRSLNGGQEWEEAELGLGTDGQGLPPGNSLIANLGVDGHGSFYLSSGHSHAAANAIYKWNAGTSRWDSLRALSGGERFIEESLTFGPEAGHLLVSYLSGDSLCLTQQSFDDGASWSTIFLSDSSYTKCAAVAPWDPQLIYLAQGGADFRRPSESFSPWRSQNGGLSWERVDENLILPNFNALDISSSGRIWAGSAGACVAQRAAESTGMEEGPPPALASISCHPNPLNPSTILSFQLGRTAEVELSLHDLAGRKLRELWRGSLEAGAHRLEWDGRNEEGRLMASGVYFFRLRAGNETLGLKAVLLK